MSVLSRASWGADSPTRTPAKIHTPSPRLWLHHSAGSGTNDRAVKAIQKWHMGHHGWSDIAYSFLVGDKVWAGRGVGVDHLTSDSTGSHSICLLGNYQTGPVPQPIIERAGWLVAHGILSGWWSGGLNGGHRDIPGGTPSACPGDHGIAAVGAINQHATNIINSLTGADMSQTERFMTRPDGTIPGDWHDGAGAILTTNHKVGLVDSRTATILARLNALTGKVDGIAASLNGGTPDDVIAYLEEHLGSLADQIAAIETSDGGSGSDLTPEQLIQLFADALVAGIANQ